MSSQEFKIVLAGQFGSGRTTFASQLVQAKADKKKIPALKTVIYPIKLWTSGGSVSLKLYDTELHAKGGIPDAEFFRQADAALIFYDTTKQSSYDALEEWFNAVQDANSRKGSAPLPVIIVGTKIDLVKDRAVKPEDVIFAHIKNLPYLEISSKAGYNIEPLLLGLCRALLGRGTQLTDKPELETATAEVDPEDAKAVMAEYVKAGKK